MSSPISTCEIIKAAKGDEEAYKRLLEKSIYNRAWGCWTQFGCQHDPPCENPSDEQMEALNERLQKDIKSHFDALPPVKPWLPEGKEGEPGRVIVPMINRKFPELLASEIVGVQPMSNYVFPIKEKL